MNKGKLFVEINCSVQPKTNILALIYRSKSWVANSGRNDLKEKSYISLNKSFTVCATHFETTCFMNDSKKSLVWNAVPTLEGIAFPVCAKLTGISFEIIEYIVYRTNLLSFCNLAMVMKGV